jgi:hypothetical protein
MILYHGSNMVIEKPEIRISHRTLDFGSGFYTTVNRRQATDFSRKVMNRSKSKTSFVSVYHFDENRAGKKMRIVQFTKPDEHWLDFVYQNRRAVYNGPGYDIIIGPVANDDIYTTLQLYENGALSKEQTLTALKIKQLYSQYVFASEASLDFLEYQRFFDSATEATP